MFPHFFFFSNLYFFKCIATPSFIEAPIDVEINEGGSIKLPCRAQGRPKARIIWDRVGLLAMPPINEEVSQFLEEESQEELLAKAKIMSLRTKREHNDSTATRTKRQVLVESTIPEVSHIPDLYIDEESNRQKRDQSMNLIVSEFRQIMRDANQETFDTNFRKKREIAVGERNDDIAASNATPILFFSTPSPTESPNLVVNDNGELVLNDITTKDQVRRRSRRVFFYINN